MNFTASGKTYSVVLDGIAIREIRRAGTLLQGGKEVPIDLCDPLHIISLDRDLPALIEVCRVLCKKSIQESGVSHDDFSRLFKGDTIPEAHRAVVEAALAFFHESVKSEIAMCWEGRTMERRQFQELMKRQPQIQQAALAKLNLSLDDLLTKLSDSPAGET